MKFKEIPTSWLVALLMVSMVTLRCFGIDSWTTAGMGIISGWMMGKHVEQTKRRK